MEKIWIAVTATLIITLTGFSQTPAFPGAEGFGAMTTGGRGGAVIAVTNLNDHGPGSLRSAIQASGARTVVFRVSGTIELESELRIDNGNITIAGQTAPGDGICLKNYPLTIDADNVIIRFIRSRHGDESGSQGDAMWGREQENIIIDHCSLSWSVDETGSFYDNRNFTLQYCILSESLYNSIHDKEEHGYGGIWGGQGATFHHNLLAHHSSRNPRFNGSRYTGLPDEELVDHRNNVIYNWGGNSCYGGEAGNHNMVANYYRYGPATSTVSKRDRIIEPDANENGYGFYYIAGNVTHGYPATTEDNWRGVEGIGSTVKEEIRLDEPLAAPALTPHTPYEAYEHVLAKAGAVLPKRDSIDLRIVKEARTGTAQFGGAYGEGLGIIDTPATVGGYVHLKSEAPPLDSDGDGMPDSWEDDMGLDKNDPADRNGDDSGNGYTNLEEYLNALVDSFEYILRPAEVAVDTIIGYEVTLTWKDISDNENGFVIERKDGETWTMVATTEAGVTSYTDRSLTGNALHYYRLKSISSTMESAYTDSVAAQLTVGTDPAIALPGTVKIFPNPFSETTTVAYTLTHSAPVTVSLLDNTGRKILQLPQGILGPGDHSVSLDAGTGSTGLYILRITAGNASVHRKVMLVR